MNGLRILWQAAEPLAIVGGMVGGFAGVPAYFLGWRGRNAR